MERTVVRPTGSGRPDRAGCRKVLKELTETADDRIYVDVNPRDDSPDVLGLIVERRTGVVYGNQVGGLECIWRALEGFLVVLGTGRIPQCFIDLFARYRGWPPASRADWSREDLADLASLIARTAPFVTTGLDGFGETRSAIRLADERLDELTEGWIPVAFADMRGVLVFPNSD